MSIQELDYYFPFFVMSYGLVMTLLTQADWAQKALERLPSDIQARFRAHVGIGFVCLIVGSLWSLQNLFQGY